MILSAISCLVTLYLAIGIIYNLMRGYRNAQRFESDLAKERTFIYGFVMIILIITIVLMSFLSIPLYFLNSTFDLLTEFLVVGTMVFYFKFFRELIYRYAHYNYIQTNYYDIEDDSPVR